LRPLLQGNDIEAFLIACRKCRGLPPKERTVAVPLPKSLAAATDPARAAVVPKRTGPADGNETAAVVAVIQHELPSFSAADMQKSFDRLGLDSFAMLLIRSR